MNSEVISIRIKKEVKEALKKTGIDISETVKEYLDKFAREIESREAMERLETIVHKRVKPSKTGFALKSVREDRNESH